MQGSDHEPTTHTVESSDDVRVALHHLGGDGRPLIICHATGFHARAYLPLARLLGAEFSVWAIDFRGHGASTAPSSGIFTWKGMTEDLLACLPTIGDQPVRAVGHSLGGAIVLKTHLAKPDAIASAYLYEPVVFPAVAPSERREANPMSVAARRRRPTFASKYAARERYSSRPPLNELSDDSMAAYVEHGFVETPSGEVALACTPENEARVFEAEDKLTFDRLGDVSLRTMIAAGNRNRIGSLADLAHGATERIGGSILVDHPELGHFGPLEDPEGIASEILEWFGPDGTPRHDRLGHRRPG